MIRSAAVVALLALALMPAGAAAQTELNVLPNGQHQPGAQWATAPGMLPANTQALMYDRLTPLGRNITPAVMRPSLDGSGYFKSARMLAADDPSLITDETIASGELSARIRRDAYGVPHIYSSTDAGAIFGAGYALAQDRTLLLDQARDNGMAAAIDMPGVSAIELVLGLYDYEPSARVRRQAVRMQSRALRRSGVAGRQVLRDIDTYLVGINKWYSANRADARPFDRGDIYAFNAIKGQFLGEGGGQEVENAMFYDTARDRFGARRGAQVYEDLKQRNDPETSTTTRRRAPFQTRVPVLRPRGMVRLDSGSFRDTGVELPDQGEAAASVAAPSEASNTLLVAGDRSAAGTPIFVGGPQIGYNYPGLTLEMGLYGPNIRWRGSTAAPFPGYALIGRTDDFAWMIPAADGDIMDTYAERLCGGSRTRYVYRGRCRRMERVNAGTIARGGDEVRARFLRTVHGPVLGYARVPGSNRRVALARKRSSYGRDATDLLFNQQISYGRVNSARDFMRAASRSPQTFNTMYASDSEIALYTAGRLPVRPRGVNPDLPVDGRGRHEWRGFLRASRHPQDVNPADGLLVSWNNKPARGWPASDSRWDEGGVQRDDWLLAELARTEKHTPATVLGAANAAATADPRGLMWPSVKAVLDRGTAPSPLASAVVDQITAWSAGDASWVDANGDGRIDASGQAAMAAVWDELSGAALCGRLGASLCDVLETRLARFERPPQQNMYGGWHQYIGKDLRTLLGQRVRGRFNVRYCGRGSVQRCAADLWAAIERGARAAAARQGTDDPAAWSSPVATISFTPLPLATIQYTNRPSGIQSVHQFAP